MYYSSVDLAVELIRIRDRLPEHKDVIDEAISAIGERDRLRQACESTINVLNSVEWLVKPFPETEETLSHFLVNGKLREIVEAAIKGSADDAKVVEG